MYRNTNMKVKIMNQLTTIKVENSDTCNCVGESTCDTKTQRSTLNPKSIPNEDLVLVQFLDRLEAVYPFDGSLFMIDECEYSPEFINKLKHIEPIQFILGLPPKKLECIFTNKVITKFNERLKIFDEVYSEIEEAGGYEEEFHLYTHGTFMKYQSIINEVMKTLGYRGEFGDDINELMDDF